MTCFPLLRSYQTTDYIAWKNGIPVSQTDFFSHVAGLQKLLPNQTHVINLCADRYLFLVGFSAALNRRQTTLLPTHNAAHVLRQLGEDYPNSYYLTDNTDSVEGIPGLVLNSDDLPQELPLDNFCLPESHIAAIAFTSGSTGTPRPNIKTWGSLVSIAHRTYTRIQIDQSQSPVTVVATVPHQHMYGLETSIMLPIQHGWALTADRPFFPEDIRTSLSRVPSPRILVSTPIHLRACITEHTNLPETAAILSATSPLPDSLAQEVESTYSTKILEIYGFAEAGTIATRETVRVKHWTLLDELTLVINRTEVCVETPYHPQPITIPDVLTAHNAREFLLEGRPKNLVNIGGHRASLDDLTCQLANIDGVTDAVFYSPPNTDETVTRLIAFAVAPGKTPEQILKILRAKISPAFLPRPLYIVDALPRNPTGKITAEALAKLADHEIHRGSSNDEVRR